MSEYTITTTDVEDEAIAYTAGSPDVDKQQYLSDCVHGQLIQPWTVRYQAANATAAPVDVARAYVSADPTVQQQVNDLLGVEPAPPPAERQSRAQPPGETGLEGVPTT